MVRYEHKLDNAQKFHFFAMKECSDKKFMNTKIEDICKPSKSCFDDFVIALTVKLPETNFWGKENLHLLESGQVPDDFKIFECIGPSCSNVLRQIISFHFAIWSYLWVQETDRRIWHLVQKYGIQEDLFYFALISLDFALLVLNLLSHS